MVSGVKSKSQKRQTEEKHSEANLVIKVYNKSNKKRDGNSSSNE